VNQKSSALKVKTRKTCTKLKKTKAKLVIACLGFTFVDLIRYPYQNCWFSMSLAANKEPRSYRACFFFLFLFSKIFELNLLPFFPNKKKKDRLKRRVLACGDLDDQTSTF